MDLSTPQKIPIPVSLTGVPEGTNDTTQTAKPVTAGERIQSIDIIRGVALFGILLMNMPGFGIDYSVFENIIRGPHNSADFYTLGVISVFFEGTMRGLFSMLFGVGMVLFTLNKLEKPGGVTVAELYYRRLLWLVLFGVINAYLFLWFGDILFFYGLCGMVLYPFRRTGAKWLLILGLVCIGIAMIKNQLYHSDTRSQRIEYLEAIKAEKEGKKLTPEQEQARTAWVAIENRRPDTADTERNISKMRSDYGTVFMHILPRNAGGESWGMYHWAIWDCTALMLIGMALFRMGFFSNKFSTSNYLLALIVGYGVGIPIGYVMFTQGDLGRINLGAYMDSFSVTHFVLYDFKRVFLSLGHASLVMLIFRSGVLSWLMKGMANVGRMAFTNYLMQSIICTLIFYGYGFGYYNKLQFHQLYYVVGAVWVFQLIVSAIWLRYYRFGPFEWLWRSLTYWKKQPMRKEVRHSQA